MEETRALPGGSVRAFWASRAERGNHTIIPYAADILRLSPSAGSDGRIRYTGASISWCTMTAIPHE